MTTLSRRPWFILGPVLLLVLLALSVSLGLWRAHSVSAKGANKQTMAAWVGNSAQQTLDSRHSFSIARCDATDTLTVNGHLQKTNQGGQTLQAAYQLDGHVPVLTGVFFTPNRVGNVNFSFAVANVLPGQHTVVVEINSTPSPGAILYINSSANNISTSPGISFTCP